MKMQNWQIELYQNDLCADVRDDYITKLKIGKKDDEALQEILSEYKDEQEDSDCKYDFFIGLADTLWKMGRLTNDIKERAMEMIEEDRLSERWQFEEIRKDRIDLLDKLEAQLRSPMPKRKKISVHKPYVLGWEEGDVYAFQIKEQIKGYEKYVGWYVLFYIDKIYLKDWYVHGVQDEVADAYFF